jgi:threonyl-tRNA synthetase
LPDRFGLKFDNDEGIEERPVVIHRALLGSLERFFGIYLEHFVDTFNLFRLDSIFFFEGR